MNPRARVGVVLVVHLVVATLTWRDLNRRTEAEVRGRKWVWRVTSGANTLGSIAYWLFGRKPGRNEDRLDIGSLTPEAGPLA